jgi:hypothetical protein
VAVRQVLLVAPRKSAGKAALTTRSKEARRAQASRRAQAARPTRVRPVPTAQPKQEQEPALQRAQPVTAAPAKAATRAVQQGWEAAPEAQQTEAAG